MGTEREVVAGAAMDAFGQGLFYGRRWRFDLEHFADGGEDGFPVGAGHPTRQCLQRTT